MAKKLQTEVAAFIMDHVATQERINKSWVVHEFVRQKGDLPEGDYDREFYREGAYYAVTAAASKALRKAGEIDPEETPQLVLPGYELVQVAYSVQGKDGEPELVQTRLISDKALLERADEYEAQAKGLTSHARELREYVMNRAIAV